jgi:hypothetical protein
MVRTADLRWWWHRLHEIVAKRTMLPRLRLPSDVVPRRAVARPATNVMVPMRDGVRLATDIYLPERSSSGGEAFPTVLIRMPYGKDEAYCQLPAHGKYWAQRGYACVIQDVRGRWSSEGRFDPFVNEERDGYDTIDWAAAQPWSDGKIGMTGESYYGYTQWAAAVAGHPALTCIAPGDTAADIYGVWVYVNNCFCLQTMGTWAYQCQGPRDVNYYRYDPWHLPLATIDDDAGVPSAIHKEWIVHPRRDEYWMPIDLDDRYADVRVPALHWGGWYDVFLKGTIDGWRGVRDAATDAAVREAQFLTIGATDHELTPETTGRVGRLPILGHGYAHDRVCRFFDHYLRGDDNGVADEPRVQYFVMGRNEWRQADDWPPPGGGPLDLYLHGTGPRRLSPDPPTDGAAPSGYAYDPDDPVRPWLGKNLWELAREMTCRGVLADRADVLVFDSPPLADDLEVTGPVRATLHASSSAPDTDFTAALVDVFPDGYCHLVQEGITRGRHRGSDRVETLLEPDRAYEFTVDLWHTSYLFAAGHRLRLEISSSNFDRFDRNLNTGRPSGFDGRRQIARQTVFHDAQRPSRLTVTVAGPKARFATP